ncbi:metal-dependent transcriptional regulator [uncultured Thomasclavelia sp.]|uniref:metal-dependent transcriptional regulator n=1 Tax=uncultured Thomasclavelia sp. TaxID=3025759 RepID=UPI0025E780E5|nr:metal-dependent transcriptional regulator [uncultured Thomasclavelia sp.]
MEEMTIAMQNYLELIYELSLDGKKARVSDIAKRLGVSKPSVNNAVVVLSKDGYVDYEKYADIKLTPKGLELAEFICNKHQTIKKLFIEVLNIDEEIADKDACLIEHVISNESIKAMQEYLNNREKSK